MSKLRKDIQQVTEAEDEDEEEEGSHINSPTANSHPVSSQLVTPHDAKPESLLPPSDDNLPKLPNSLTTHEEFFAGCDDFA